MESEHKEIVVMPHERIRWAIIGVLVLLGLFLGAQTIGAVKGWRYIGGGVPVTNVVTVSGKGEVFAKPDIATFTFSIIEEKPTAKQAQDAATEKVNAVIAYLKGQGIDEKDIRTSGYNVYPKYDYPNTKICSTMYCPPAGEAVIRGYEVNQSVEVKVRDTNKAGILLSGIGELGVGNVSGLNFTMDDEDAAMREARAKAIADAKQKADELADDLGVSLVRVVSFSENGGGGPIPYYYDKAMGLGVSEAGAPRAPEVPTGENSIVSNVSITYEIR